ncbi:MAG: transporter [Phaeodactylibacter sp.]|nr:transporter [Phaeodactylibacter sp.]MCB9275693.1 transporter [Lewinellaceae bacterium]
MKLSDITSSLGRSRRGKQSEKDNDLGFGTNITTYGERLINPDGSFNIVRRGVSNWRPYQDLVEMSWLRFFGVIVAFYILVNSFFALLFVAAGVDSLSGVNPGGSLGRDFASAFFFSVQTFTTVGYGAMSPNGVWANIVASVVALVGLMSFALATGLFFARFSRPKASILFSDKAVIRPYKDTPYLSFQFQIVNERNNKLINVSARLTVSWVENLDGVKTRRFANLELERDQVLLFPLNWVVVHVINKESPLWGRAEQEIKDMQPEFLALIQAYDDTFAQEVHANGSYTSREIHWNRRFERMYYPQGVYTVLELGRLHDVAELEEE